MRFSPSSIPMSGSSFVPWSQRTLSSRTALTTRLSSFRLDAASTNRKHTFSATAAEGITYSLDGMDSDILSRLTTKSGPLVLIPYPAVTVDMGQYLERFKGPSDIERLWIEYVTGLAREAEAHPDREATIVAIGIHPFVVGTPDGATALRRVLENFKNQKLVWVTDVQAVLDVAGEKQ